MSVHALILAGGRGSRLGDVRKADLRLGHRTLLQRVADRLDGLPLMIATGPGPAPQHLPGTALPDADTVHQGPMAGIAAAIAHLAAQAAPDDILLTVAVDTPFLPADYASRLFAALQAGAPAAYARHAGNPYPTNAAWRLSALLGPLPDSPRRLLEALGAVGVDWPADAPDPFANLNTLADLVSLARRLP